MTNKLAGLLLMLAAVTVESFAQLCLKLGAAGGARILSHPFRGFASRIQIGSETRVWYALAVAAYGLEILIYTLALQRLDVSVAFPLGSACFVGVAFLSKIFLGEAVGTIRWLGIGFILAGATLTSWR
jgi:uncharacterized membrane protein